MRYPAYVHATLRVMAGDVKGRQRVSSTTTATATITTTTITNTTTSPARRKGVASEILRQIRLQAENSLLFFSLL
ncbi:hypothetical protein E2C01_049106 [Portunus trituberculatus]|uniref:Uncharacterized protein n=1 Tax=Portunus trituberculatus TaxID=210409 RepID=A0A5B7GCS9_PORTR|nr:hypothetical protein [Portunus trituberculatus]